MDYLLFDMLALALPATVLLGTARRRKGLLGPGTVLAAVALLWTAPWDEYLVRTGIWTYAPGGVLLRLGAVPAEEYVFVVLEVLLVGAWAMRVGALGAPGDPAGVATADTGDRRRGALAWCAVAACGAVLVVLGGQVTYLGLLLLWAAIPLALQRAVAGDVLVRHRSARLRVVLPVAVWLCIADRCALAAGIWTISPASSTGVTVAGLPVEEALFFGLTCLLVADGLVLATDEAVLRRVALVVAGLRGSAGPRRSTAASTPAPQGRGGGGCRRAVRGAASSTPHS